MQTAILFNTLYIVQYASFCGARSAIVHSDFPDNPYGYAVLSSKTVLLAMGLKMESAFSYTKVLIYDGGREIEVTVTYPVRPIIPVVGKFLPVIPVSASTRMPLEK
jgi:hypothetical protein